MDPEFWHAKWEAGTLGFHLTDVNPNLRDLADKLPPPPSRVLVPLCGKTVDMRWLAARGHRVLGVELSATAVDAFFAESELPQPVEVSEVGAFRSHRAGGIEILQGDIFDLRAADVGTIDAVYDRAALIALPGAMRRRYARLLFELLPGGAVQLLITLDAPDRETGPPFSIEADAVGALFGNDFAIDELPKHLIDDQDTFAGMHEGRYVLTRHSS